MTSKPNPEFENFDHTMRKLMTVSHETLKAKLEAEKADKPKKKTQDVKKK